MVTKAEAAVTTTSEETAQRLAPIEDAVIALARVWSNLQLYPAGHPVMARELDEAERLLGGLLDEQGELSLKRLHGELLYGPHRLFAHRPRPEGLLGALGAWGVDCVTFSQGVTTAELAALGSVLCLSPGDGIDGRPSTGSGQGGRPPHAESESDGRGRPSYAEEVRANLSAAGVEHIRLDELSIVADGASHRGRLDTGMPLSELYQSAVACARQTMHAVRTDSAIDVALSMGVVDELVDRVTQDRATAMTLACIKGHDEYTLAHSVHVAVLSVAFGDAIGLNGDELRELGVAALLHDVGKVFVPTEVLRKPGKLSGDEWDLMRRHPVEGASVLVGCRDLPAAAAVVAFEHHLRCDHTGYPQASRSRDISLWSMVVSLADTYDALTSCRPYRLALPPPEAALELDRMANGQCDPRLVAWFREMLGLHPPGTCVRLDTGECGVVCRSNADDPGRPAVWIFLDARGQPLLTPHEVRLDEALSGPGRYRRSIVETTVSPEALAQGARALDAWLQAGAEGGEGDGAVD